MTVFCDLSGMLPLSPEVPSVPRNLDDLEQKGPGFNSYADMEQVFNLRNVRKGILNFSVLIRTTQCSRNVCLVEIMRTRYLFTEDFRTTEAR